MRLQCPMAQLSSRSAAGLQPVGFTVKSIQALKIFNHGISTWTTAHISTLCIYHAFPIDERSISDLCANLHGAAPDLPVDVIDLLYSPHIIMKLYEHLIILWYCYSAAMTVDETA